MKGKRLFAASVLLSTHMVFSTTLASEPIQITAAEQATAQKKVQQFINNMVEKKGLDREQLNALLLKRKPLIPIINAMNRPYESKPWSEYRAIFIQPDRIAQGVVYWKAHQKTLSSVAKQYGVDPKVMLGIMGVETKYGQYACSYKVVDALYTLAFYYPKREKFFQKELGQFLLLSKEQHLKPTELCGSYAGAIGVPQFMPSSYRHYAIDYDKTGSIDLLNNHNDAIASIANYLKKAGWQYQQPVASRTKGSQLELAKLKSNSAKKYISATQLKKYGIDSNDKTSLARAKKAAIIDLPINNKNNYWLVYPNFGVIMHYNPRIQYAMAVYQLGEAIQSKIDEMEAPTASQKKS